MPIYRQLSLTIQTLAILCAALFTHPSTATEQKTGFLLKTVPETHYVYSHKQLSQGSFHKEGEKIAEDTAFFIATKTDTLIDGPFTYVFENVDPAKLEQSKMVNAKLGWPVKRSTTIDNQYTYEKANALKCLTFIHEGPSSKVPESFQKLYDEAARQNLAFNGEARAIIKLSSNTGYIVTELQLGIK